MNTRRKAEMLEAFTRFSDRIAARYQEAYDALETDDYAKAQAILEQLALSHAKTSVSLRRMLIKHNLLPEEEK